MTTGVYTETYTASAGCDSTSSTRQVEATVTVSVRSQSTVPCCTYTVSS